jgi:hypothetical protein
MREFRDSIEVNAPAGVVFGWLSQRLMDAESYKAWHPDHVDIRWIKGRPLRDGSVAYAEEYLHGRLHKMKFRITKIVPDRLIEYRALFPFSLMSPCNKFIVEPKSDSSCTFIATGILKLPEWLCKKHEDKIEAVLRHMKKEGENLKKALEPD